MFQQDMENQRVLQCQRDRSARLDKPAAQSYQLNNTEMLDTPNRSKAQLCLKRFPQDMSSVTRCLEDKSVLMCTAESASHCQMDSKMSHHIAALVSSSQSQDSSIQLYKAHNLQLSCCGCCLKRCRPHSELEHCYQFHSSAQASKARHMQSHWLELV